MKQLIFLVIFFSSSLLGCVEDEPSIQRLDLALESGQYVRLGNLEPHDPSEIVYQEVKTKHATDLAFELIDREGFLDFAMKQRVARPYRHLGPDEEFVYDEKAWGSVDHLGRVEQGYRVTRRINDNPYVYEPDTRPAFLVPELSESLQETTGNPIIRVLIQVRDFPDWDVPIVPKAGFLSAQDHQMFTKARNEKIATRKFLLTSKATDILSYIINNNGLLVREAWGTGYIVADLPVLAVTDLLRIPQVVVVEPDVAESAGDGAEFYVGDQGGDARTETGDFVDEGYEGGQPNYARHGYNDMLLATIESFYFDDEACAFQDVGNSCGSAATTRIKSKYDCAGSSCGATSNFSSVQEALGAHGTVVAGVSGADYTQGQGDGHSLGDPAWVSGAHSDVWEKTASGSAREAFLSFLGGVQNCDSCRESAFQTVLADHVDVANISNGGGGGNCTPTSSRAYEDALENAYDDGVFIASNVGNNSGSTSSSCNVQSPADTPKAFAVTGLGTNKTVCELDYQECYSDVLHSALGGGNITIQGSSFSAALNDITAPARLRRRTSRASGFPYGIVYENHVGGTSISTPVVSGAALVLKDFILSNGQTWINSPGRLQAMVLGMADSWHDLSHNRSNYGLDNLSGVGRLKMRLFDWNAAPTNKAKAPFNWILTTNTFTSTGTTMFPLYMYPGTTFAKCVVWEGEDMSAKQDVSDVWLSAKVKEPFLGTYCGVMPTATLQAQSDASFDMRHMVNFDSNLSGKCLEVTLNVGHVTSQGATVNTFCYFAGEADNEN